jgi:hypothetical protein
VILVDTSGWVEYDRSTGSPAAERLRSLIARDEPVLAVSEPVIAGVLPLALDEATLR